MLNSASEPVNLTTPWLQSRFNLTLKAVSQGIKRLHEPIVCFHCATAPHIRMTANPSFQPDAPMAKPVPVARRGELTNLKVRTINGRIYFQLLQKSQAAAVCSGGSMPERRQDTLQPHGQLEEIRISGVCWERQWDEALVTAQVRCYVCSERPPSEMFHLPIRDTRGAVKVQTGQK
ncbi:unnamed protein product [Pleuronectes platessa]|uniref:Uncharacterized protein n=1 Tax=Pleuronectes platessa TaxID=8262 RepID=A0A9N7W103_PLEPL|nr:unnamed protein product [Pleuronectes platessa]